jgi:tryptophan synthase alpha chain
MQKIKIDLPYLRIPVAGDNTKKKSLEILKSISNYADICELGFPHNTPIADGGPNSNQCI